ncbi:MAG: agmatine deiminase family protein, partial [Desulfobacterales bacterium]|nr:agmatine deiminase family protein [Desulfobacterales bacterium]
RPSKTKMTGTPYLFRTCLSPKTQTPKIQSNPMTQILTSTPRQDGFRMLGEFETHSRCWMLWPERAGNWRLDAGPAQNDFARVARAVMKNQGIDGYQPLYP